MNSHGIWTTRLVLAGISNAEMDSLASTLRSDRLQVDVLRVDLADECSIAALVEKSNEAERVAIASGIYISSSALTTSRAEIDSVLAINLYGVFFTAQHYARAMISRKSGSIVAIGSISGRFPRLGQVAYGAAKLACAKLCGCLPWKQFPMGYVLI